VDTVEPYGAGGTGGSPQASVAATASGSSGSTGAHGSGGASSSSGTGGACDLYAGTGLDTFTPLMGANIAPASFDVDGSVRAIYDSTANETDFNTGGNPCGYCGIGADVYLSGSPKMGPYTIVDKATHDNHQVFIGGNNVYIEAGEQLMLGDGGCEALDRTFGSVPGTGSVSVDLVSGNHVKVTVSGVHATGIVDSMNDGQGTIQLDMSFEADCFVSQ
jgi:hypothetical protein